MPANYRFHCKQASVLTQQGGDSAQAKTILAVALRALAAAGMLNCFLATQVKVDATDTRSPVDIQAQMACESKMLREMGAYEIFSGKVYEVLSDVAQAYGRAIPHIYLVSGSLNMAFIAGSTAVDKRGKIVVGQQAIKMFDHVALKGFLGHEMAHLVSDSPHPGCDDQILRDPQAEADADALAARTLGTRPVKAFLRRVLVLTHSKNGEAKQRLQRLQ